VFVDPVALDTESLGDRSRVEQFPALRFRGEQLRDPPGDRLDRRCFQMDLRSLHQ